MQRENQATQPVSLFQYDLAKQFFGNLLVIVTGLFSASLEVFLRRNFGTRYLGWIRLFLTTATMVGIHWTMATGFGLTANAAPMGVSRVMTVFTAAVVGLGLYHRITIWQRRRAGQAGHSFARGQAWGFWTWLPVSDDVVYRYLEPALCVAVGWAIPDRITGAWILVSGVMLFVKHQVEHHQERSRLLDLTDSRAEVETLTASVDQAQPHPSLATAPRQGQAEGQKEEFSVTVADFPPPGEETTVTVASAFAALESEFQSIINENTPRK